MAVIEEEEESITRAEMWDLLSIYTTMDSTFYKHKMTFFVAIRRVGYKWHLYIENLNKAVAFVALDPTQKDKNTLDSALEAFKDIREKLDRAIPYLLQSEEGNWDCPMCGKDIPFGQTAFQHIDNHLTIVKSANKN
jgi:hypothetical protein